jgi:DedD protein
MTRASDRESSYSPKHRIVGAIILVSLAVIFLPMILNPDQPTPRPKDATRLNEIPKPETQVFRMPAASLDQVGSPESSQDMAVSSADATGSEKGSGAARPSTSVAKATTDKRDREDARKDIDMRTAPETSADKSTQQDTQVSTSVDTAAATKKAEGWVVQVGAFSDGESARRLQDRLQQSGFLVNLQSVDLKGRKVVRVRVGPYRQKRVAMDARSRIEKEVGLEGVVLAYP